MWNCLQGNATESLLLDDKSTLFQVMAWCYQETSHYLSLCWPRSMSSCGITWLQSVQFILFLLQNYGFVVFDDEKSVQNVLNNKGVSLWKYLWDWIVRYRNDHDDGRVTYKGFLSLTHWGRVTHICVSNPTITGSDNGLSPGRPQAIIWTNAGILLIRPLGTNFSEILMAAIFQTTFSNAFSWMKIYEFRFCLGLNVLHPFDL